MTSSRRHARRALPRLAALAACALLAGACARPGVDVAPEPISAEALARLEKAADAPSPNAAALRALGVAYYDRGRDADARRVLDRAAELAPKDGVVALYRGLAAERQGDAAGARQAYASYVKVGRTRAVRRQLELRLAALAREELAEEARRAIVHERTLAEQPGDARTVAVLPFAFHGTDSTLRPLARGLTELLVTDLSRAPELTVVERVRVQALLDELTLVRMGRVDSTTAVRTGRLVRAGRVVQGALTQLDARALRADAAVVDATTAAVTATVRDGEPLDELFALEQRLALRLLAELGVALTAVQRRELDRRPTRDLAAFLSYSHGLLAEDEGRMEDAERHYGEAARLDPAFVAPRAAMTRAAAARQGATVGATTLRASLRGTSEGATVAAASRATPAVAPVAGTLGELVNQLNPSAAGAAAAPTRDAASATAGSDAVGPGTGRIHIVIRPPGGR
jgi:TolB-like protein